MTTVIIERSSVNGDKFRAAARNVESFGKTMGEALDALVRDLDTTDSQTSVIVRDFRPDEFFTETQQRRLEFLMRKLDRATNIGSEFLPAEWIELEHLIEAELDGAIRRQEAILEKAE